MFVGDSPDKTIPKMGYVEINPFTNQYYDFANSKYPLVVTCPDTTYNLTVVPKDGFEFYKWIIKKNCTESTESDADVFIINLKSGDNFEAYAFFKKKIDPTPEPTIEVTPYPTIYPTACPTPEPVEPEKTLLERIIEIIMAMLEDIFG